MSVPGFPFQVDGLNWLENALSQPVRPEERSFNYSNQAAYLAGVIAARAFGRPLEDVLAERLFSPLHIGAPKFMRSPEGLFYGASKMKLTVNELSRIGRVFLDGGVYEGTRIVPESFARAAMERQIENAEGGYGYFLWKDRDGASLQGSFGQRCFLRPGTGEMLTVLAHVDKETEEKLYAGIG